jgi:hypothetical protein
MGRHSTTHDDRTARAALPADDSIAPPGEPVDPGIPGAPDTPGVPDAPMPGAPEPMPGSPEITPSEPPPFDPEEASLIGGARLGTEPGQVPGGRAF